MPRDRPPSAGLTPRPVVAVLEPGYADYTTEAAVLSDLGARIERVTPEEAAVPRLRALDPVAITVRERAVTAAVIEACPNLKVIVRYGVGVDNIDMEAARARRIHVANIPDYWAEIEVSEHALALYLAAQRRIVSRDAQVRRGEWGSARRRASPRAKGRCWG